MFVFSATKGGWGPWKVSGVCSKTCLFFQRQKEDGVRGRFQEFVAKHVCFFSDKRWMGSVEGFRSLQQNMFVFSATKGGWGPWKVSGVCSKTCGGGLVTSLRVCNQPITFRGGDMCTKVNGKPGLVEIKSKPCNEKICPGTLSFIYKKNNPR